MIALPPGSVFHGRYEVVRCIKAGGMGAVYEVIHIETRRRRALKLMLPAVLERVEMRARFALEATVAADVESEHIVDTVDAGFDDETGAPFLVMELLLGSDLAAVLARRRRLAPADVARLLWQAASALDRTHAAGVVHRDLKPENLFVTRRDDGSPKLKILDFGIAKIVSESGQAAAKTKVLGTPLYMSPEQVRGDGTIGPPADLYALAHIAFTLLAGKAYWAEEHDALPTYALMTKILGGCPAPASERAASYGGATPPAFDAWFARATRVVPEERFPSATAMIEALARALGVEVPRSRAEELVTLPRLRPADLAGGSTHTLPLAEGHTTVPETPDFDRDVVPEAAPPEPSPNASSHGSQTEEPASMTSRERPRSRANPRRIAALAVAAAIVLAIAALTVRRGGLLASQPDADARPLGSWRPAASAAPERSTLSSLSSRSPLASSPLAVPPWAPASPPGTLTSPPLTSSAPAPEAVSARVPARRNVPSTSRATAEPAPTAAPGSSAPPAARPAPTEDAHPPRSLD